MRGAVVHQHQRPTDGRLTRAGKPPGLSRRQLALVPAQRFRYEDLR